MNRHTSINLLLHFNVDALKKLAQHILESTKTLPRENEVTLQKFVPGPTDARKIGSLRNDNGDGNENGKKAEG